MCGLELKKPLRSNEAFYERPPKRVLQSLSLMLLSINRLLSAPLDHLLRLLLDQRLYLCCSRFFTSSALFLAATVRVHLLLVFKSCALSCSISGVRVWRSFYPLVSSPLRSEPSSRPRSDTFSKASTCIIFVMAASVVMSYPLITPIS